MDTSKEQELSLEEATNLLLGDLPKPVQDFYNGPKRAEIALALAKKYQLHADQAGDFEHAFMCMLLGISSPEEFVDELTQSGIPEEKVRQLAVDVNEQVFVPLRKAEQSQPRPTARMAEPVTLPGSSVPVPPPVPHRPEPAPLVPPPSLVPPPAPQMPHYMYMQPHMPQQMLYMPQYGMPYGPTPMYVWPPAPQPWPIPQGMSMEHLQQFAAQHQASIAAAAPAPSQPRALETERPAYAPPPHPVAPLTQTQPLAKEYVADPYREGI